MTANREGICTVGLANKPFILPLKLLVVCCLAGLYSIQADASGLTNNRHLNLHLIPAGFRPARLLPLNHKSLPYTKHVSIFLVPKR